MHVSNGLYVADATWPEPAQGPNMELERKRPLREAAAGVAGTSLSDVLVAHEACRDRARAHAVAIRSGSVQAGGR